MKYLTLYSVVGGDRKDDHIVVRPVDPLTVDIDSVVERRDQVEKLKALRVNAFAGNFVPATAKFIPNPYGKLGGIAHRAAVAAIAADIMSRGYTPALEYFVGTPGGFKQCRFCDVVAIDQTSQLPVEYYQVGKQTLGGKPIARETQALDDIESATGTRPLFVPYN